MKCHEVSCASRRAVWSGENLTFFNSSSTPTPPGERVVRDEARAGAWLLEGESQQWKVYVQRARILSILSLSWSFEGSSGGVWPRARARVEQSINSTYPLPLQAARARVRARVACGCSVGVLWVLVRADVLQLQAARAHARARVGRWCSDGVPMVLLCADVLKTPGRSRACVRARVERWCFGGVLGVLVCVRVLHHLARVCAPAR